MGTQALADIIPVDKSCAFVYMCEPAHRHAWDSRHLGAEAVSARFHGGGGAAAPCSVPVCTHAQELHMHYPHPCVGIVHLHIHAYRHTPVGLYTRLGIGHSHIHGFMHVLGVVPQRQAACVLVHKPVDIHSSLTRVSGAWAVFMMWFTNLHWEGLPCVQGSGLLLLMA